MANIPKKVTGRFIKQVSKFKRILKKALDRDVNEADTVNIVVDILCEVFGFDKYTEITREYAIRHTYCDLAVKLGEEIKYLIEVKAVSTELKQVHLRQAVNYGAHEGIQWVILTNGFNWEVYNLRIKKKVQYNKVFEIDFLSINPRKSEDQELLFLLAKEGIHKDVITDYHERIKSVNPYVIGAILTGNPALTFIRRELRRLTPKLRIDTDEIEAILKNEVLKRNVVEGDEAGEAQRRVKREVSKRKK